MTDSIFEPIPPQSLEAECSVLGACLIDRNAVHMAISILEAYGDEAFYGEAHKHIWNAIVSLKEGEDDVDSLTVMECLKSKGKLEAVGGVIYLSSLPEEVHTLSHIEHYAGIVRDYARARQLISEMSSLISMAHDNPGGIDDIVSQARQAVLGLSLPSETSLMPVSHDLGPLLTEMKALHDGDMPPPGLKTGFRDLDALTGGLQSGTVTIVGARTSVGKSAFALNVALHGLLFSEVEDPHVVFFSLEMGRKALQERMLGIVGKNLDIKAYKEGRGGDHKTLLNAAAYLRGRKIFIDDAARMSLAMMESRLERHVLQYGPIDLVVLDYLGIMHTGRRHNNRQEETAELSGAMQIMAKAYDCPFLVVVQINRAAISDGGAPSLHHIAQSGAIEGDGHNVILLHVDQTKENERQDLTVHLAKNRSGPVGTTIVKFNRWTQAMIDLDWKSKKPPEDDGPEQEDLL